MKRATLAEVMAAAVESADMLTTLDPGRDLGGAVDVACDVIGIPSDRDRRIVRHFLERRVALRAETTQRAA